MRRAAPNRTLALWLGHWPVVAAGVAATEPAAVLERGRIAAATPAALSRGVRVGQRRRQAHSCCPELVTLNPDQRREQQAFEPVLAAVAELTPVVEVCVAGECAIGVRGPARYFGGEQQLTGMILDAVGGVLARQGWPAIARIGVANGINLARLAARHLTGNTHPAVIIPPGEEADSLAQVPVGALGDPDLGEVLGLLGITTLGDLARLEHSEVLGRFGPTGSTAWHLARGIDPLGVSPSSPEPQFRVRTELDPPAERIETLAFAARSAALELTERLGRHARTARRVTVTAETEHGERNERIWGSGSGALVAGDPTRELADRIRWQMEGWLDGPVSQRPTGGVVLLDITPEGLGPLTGTQLNLYDRPSESDQAVSGAVDRLEGILGQDSVRIARPAGGRSPADAFTRVPIRMPSGQQNGPRPPWPGAVPTPSPALVHDPPLPLEVLDSHGQRLEVRARGEPSGVPCRVVRDRHPLEVVSWAGPWPADERWWADGRRRARIQLVLADGSAVLATLENGTWSAEATYD